MAKYVAFDVETPNSYNDRISSIGITVVEDGEIIREISTLVNPETHFDYFNVRLTGITPEMAAQKGTFAELWRVIAPYMSSGILVAHNAPFDMGVLSKCLCAYGIEWQPVASYACTCAMGRKCYPELENHRLNTICGHLGIELNHHDAGSDSRACARILIDCLKQGVDIGGYTRKYDLLRGRTLQKPGGAGYGSYRRWQGK